MIYGAPIPVERKDPQDVTHEELRELTDRVVRAIAQMSGQEYVDEYAQTVKARMQAEREAQSAEVTPQSV